MTATVFDLSTLKSSPSAVRRLPPTLRGVRDLVGRQATLALVERYGGTHVHVPRGCRDDRAPALLLGRGPAARFIHRFAGIRLYAAKMDAAPRATRGAEIRGLYDSGLSAARLAQKYGLSERRIRSILKGRDQGRAAAASGQSAGRLVSFRARLEIAFRLMRRGCAILIAPPCRPPPIPNWPTPLRTRAAYCPTMPGRTTPGQPPAAVG